MLYLCNAIILKYSSDKMLLTGDASSEFAAIAKLNNWSASCEHLLNTVAHDRLSQLVHLSIKYNS